MTPKCRVIVEALRISKKFALSRAIEDSEGPSLDSLLDDILANADVSIDAVDREAVLKRAKVQLKR